MIMRCRWGAALMMLLLAVSGVRAQDFAINDAKGTPVSVHTVQSGGSWESGKQEGFYRVVVVAGGFEHVIARLYVQWIATDQDEREYKLVRTVEVKDVGVASVISAVPKFSTGGPWSMALTISRRDGKQEKRAMTVQPDGRYSFK
jgi:hypothetical protein